MYLQITTRCNMSCSHCCYSCNEKGQDMTIETFRKAMSELNDDVVAIGGGEPTIHPLFWQILGECISKSESVWLATNGKEKETALALAGMARKGVLGVALSQDDYHEEIDFDVVEAFTKELRKHSGYDNHTPDCREIRNVSANLIKSGRCNWGKKGCVCSDIIVKPNGDVMGCGCKKSPCFGNVHTSVKIPDDWQYGECYKDQTKE